MPEGHVLEFSGLTKRYGAVTAVDDFTARIEPGIVTGFLGPNGAGKTTTLRMLLGLVRPTQGTATIGGVAYADLPHPARTVGAVLEATSFHPGRTASAHLTVYAQAAGVPTSRVDEVLVLVGLGAAAKRKVGGFSLGMRQRLALATALLGDPSVLVLDEPTNGLDPEGIQWMRTFLRTLAAEGRTVLVSSHMLSEVQQTVDALVMISSGRLVFQGDFSDLMADAEQSVTVDGPDRAALGAALDAAGLPATLLRNGFSLKGADALEVGAAAAAAGVTLTSLARRGPSLEDVFFELVNGERVHASSYTASIPIVGAEPVADVAEATIVGGAAAALAATAPSAPVVEPSLSTTENEILSLLTPDETGAVPIIGQPEDSAVADAGEEVSDATMAITIDDLPGIAAGDAVAAMRARGESIQLPFDGPVAAEPGLVVAAAAVNGTETAEDDGADEAAVGGEVAGATDAGVDVPADADADADDRVDADVEASAESDAEVGDDAGADADADVLSDADVESDAAAADAEAVADGDVETAHDDAADDTSNDDASSDDEPVTATDADADESNDASDDAATEAAASEDADTADASADSAPDADQPDDIDVIFHGLFNEAPAIVDADDTDQPPVRLASSDRPWWEPADIAVPTGTVSLAEAFEITEESPAADAAVVDDELPAEVVAEIAADPVIVADETAPIVGDLGEGAAEARAEVADVDGEVAEADADTDADAAAIAAEAADASTDAEGTADGDADADANADADADAEADQDQDAEAPAAPDADAEADADADANTDSDADSDADAATDTATEHSASETPAATPWWLPAPVADIADTADTSAPDVATDDAANADANADADDDAELDDETAVIQTISNEPPLFRAPAVPTEPATAPVPVTPDEAWAPRDVATSSEPWTPPAAPVRDADAVFEVAATGEIAIVQTGAIPVIPSADEPEPATDAASETDIVEAPAPDEAPVVADSAFAAEPSFDDLLNAPDAAPADDELLHADDDRGSWERRDDRTPSDDAADAFFSRFSGQEGDAPEGDATTEGGAR